MRSLKMRILVTSLAIALAMYGIASIWYSGPLASSLPWLWCALLFLASAFVSLLVVATLVLVLLLIWCKRDSGTIHKGARCAQSLPPKFHCFPYYRISGAKISCFRYKSDLHLMRFAKGLKYVDRKDQYVVAKPYTVSFEINGKPKCITVPEGMLTDLSSAPFLLRCIVGRVGPHLEATIVHDYLYIAWQDYEEQGCECDSKCSNENCDKKISKKEMRQFADEIMLEGMKASGMSCMAYLIYWGVKIGGGPTFRGRNTWRYVDLNKCKCGSEDKCECAEDDTNSDCGSYCK